MRLELWAIVLASLLVAVAAVSISRAEAGATATSTRLQVPIEMDRYFENLPETDEAYRASLPAAITSHVDALPAEERARNERFARDLPDSRLVFLAFCVMDVTRDITSVYRASGAVGENFLGMLELLDADLRTPEGRALDANARVVNIARAIIIQEKCLAFRSSRASRVDARGDLYVFSLAAADATRRRMPQGVSSVIH